MTNVQEILERFGLHPESSAPGRYYTTCPKCSTSRSRAHQKNECLGITIDDQGVKFGCNHCDFQGGALFKPNGADRSPIVATYDYDNFQVCRTADKQFPQRRPDGNGGWIWGTKGVRKVLFRLITVTEAIGNGHRILVVEGEKDVLSLERIGIVATCNPGGASEPGKTSKWKKEYSEALRDADIIIIPDHDPAGYAHADAIASMSAGIAKSVRVLKLADHWPDCPKGGDVSDWLAAGHTREELDELIEREAKPWSAEDSATEEPPQRPGNGKDNSKEQAESAKQQTAPPPNTDELLSICAAKVKMKAIEWLWPYRFAFGKLGIIAGLPDEGKGQILAYIIAMIKPQVSGRAKKVAHQKAKSFCSLPKMTSKIPSCHALSPPAPISIK
jgi:Toprim domain